MRDVATWTAACCSSALAASLADSASTSTVEPSARDRADRRVGLRAEARATASALLGVSGAERRLQRAVEVDVDPLVAGRAPRWRGWPPAPLALRGA